MATIVPPLSIPVTQSSSTSSSLSISPSLISLPNPSSSSSSTSSTPSPTPTGIAFHAIENMTACESGAVAWGFSGSSGGNLSIVVTNENVPQSPATPSRTVTPEPLESLGARNYERRDVQALSQLLVTGLDPTVGTWTWSPVNISQGWYDLEAFVLYSAESTENVFVAISTQFYVANGTDTSCLVSSTPASSSAASSSATSIPSTTLQSGKHTNVGAIVGGVIGALVGLFAILAVVLFFRTRTPTRVRARSVSGSGPSGGWGGLKSTGSQGRSRDRRLQTESVGTVVAQNEPAPYTPNGSDDDVNSIEGEKIVAARGFDNLASMGYNVKRSSTASSLASTAVSSRSRPASTSAPAPGISKRDSDGSTHNRARRSFDGGPPRRVAVPPISYMPPSHVQEQHPYPPSPQSPEPVVPLTRSASGSRRTPRKPVPKYDASEFTDVESGSEMTAPSSAQHEMIGLPDLSHKSSFGEKKMHYILPDMPPPPVD